MDYENFDLDAAIEKAVNEAITKSKAPAQPPATEPAAPKPITVNIGGQAYQFDNEASLSSALENFMSQVQQQPVQQTQPEPKTALRGDETPDWDMNQFIELMAQNPLDALDYADNFRYFDGKAPQGQASKLMRQQIEQSQKLSQVVAVEQFKQTHPEFPFQDNRAGALIERVRQTYNLPFDAMGLDAAYAIALRQNPEFNNFVEQHKQSLNRNDQAAQPFSNQSFTEQPAQNSPIPFRRPQNQQNQGFTPENPYTQAPPAMGDRTPQSTNRSLYENVEDMSADQLEELLKRFAR